MIKRILKIQFYSAIRCNCIFLMDSFLRHLPIHNPHCKKHTMVALLSFKTHSILQIKYLKFYPKTLIHKLFNH